MSLSLTLNIFLILYDVKKHWFTQWTRKNKQKSEIIENLIKAYTCNINIEYFNSEIPVYNQLFRRGCLWNFWRDSILTHFWSML